MIRSIVRYSIFFAALLLLGPLAWWLVGSLTGPDGLHRTSPLVSSAGFVGLLRAIAAIAVAFAAGVVARLVVSPRWAMFTAGGVLAWAAWGAGSIDTILRVAGDGSPLPRLAVEGVAYTLLGAALTMVLAAPRDNAAPRAQAGPALIGVLIGAAAGLLCAWVCAQSTMKGQVLAAAALGGMAAAVAAHTLNPRIPAWSVVIGLVVLGVVGPIVAIAIEPSGAALVAKANAARLFPAARLLPIDWLAGAIVGVPLGHAWGASMTEQRTAPAAAKPA